MGSGTGSKAKVVNCIPHRFRHSFGTELLSTTHDIQAVQEALGHADIGSTMGYAALADDRLAKAISTLSWDPVIATPDPSGYVSPDSRQEGQGPSARDP